MDQRNDVYDYQTKCSIDINDLIKFSGNEKKKVARRRWAILAKALKVQFVLKVFCISFICSVCCFQCVCLNHSIQA